ncbi:hypothetical protein PV797_10720 [Clostridiaceae bacterium M8S5]|nr:hypothetical protein PV797_10720 [Clostridiaceae bacterium M8S5]
MHLNHIKESDFELYELINQMYTIDTFDEQFNKMLKKCSIRITEPIGGLWEKERYLNQERRVYNKYIL